MLLAGSARAREGDTCRKDWQALITTPYPEALKTPDLAFTLTAQGLEIPILDYSNPRFQQKAPSAFRNWRSRMMLLGLSWMPPFARRLLGRHSLILGSFFPQKDGTFVTGPSTYLAKLGPSVHQPGKLDQLAAGSSQSVEASRRGHAIAALESQVLAGWLRSGPAPVTILNIGGGPASDNLGALLLLKAQEPALFGKLVDRKTPVAIHVLDPDKDGPLMGGRSLAVLQQAGGKLEGVKASLDRTPYDWTRAQGLHPLLKGAPGHVLVTAEGSLFEYGTDEDVRRNLVALHDATPPDTVVAGTFYRSEQTVNPVVKAMWKLSPHLNWQLRGLERMQQLCAQTGWQIDRIDSDNSIFYSFVLRKKAN
jgi:hypothetical protein